MRIVHHEYPSLCELESAILAVITDPIRVLLRKATKTEEVPGVVAVDQMDREAEADDRVERRGRDQIPAMQYRLGA